MAGYTKLFNSILASTIWRADDKTRIVWITLLAMADKNGMAEGSIPGLADMARVSIEDCERALIELESPDKYSRSKENEGKRIRTVDGGWFLLNHPKYREKMSADERREYNRVKQAEWRASQKLSNSVNDSQTQSALSAHSEAAPAPEADKRERAPTEHDASNSLSFKDCPSEEEFVAEAKKLKIPVKFARDKYRWQLGRGWPENWRVGFLQRVKAWCAEEGGKGGEWLPTPSVLPEPPPLTAEDIAAGERFIQDAAKRGIALTQPKPHSGASRK